MSGCRSRDRINCCSVHIHQHSVTILCTLLHLLDYFLRNLCEGWKIISFWWDSIWWVGDGGFTLSGFISNISDSGEIIAGLRGRKFDSAKSPWNFISPWCNWILFSKPFKRWRGKFCKGNLIGKEDSFLFRCFVNAKLFVMWSRVNGADERCDWKCL